MKFKEENWNELHLLKFESYNVLVIYLFIYCKWNLKLLYIYNDERILRFIIKDEKWNDKCVRIYFIVKEEKRNVQNGKI